MDGQHGAGEWQKPGLGLPRTVGWVGATWALCSGLTLPSCADPPEVLIALRFSTWLAKELQQSPR